MILIAILLIRRVDIRKAIQPWWYPFRF